LVTHHRPLEIVKQAKRFMVISSALACGVALTPPAHPGGLSLYEIATPDVGLASAGYAARAQDPSTLFTNPAGMSLLPGSQFHAGAQLIYGSVEFSPDAGTGPLLGTGSGGNAVGAMPAGSLFFSQSLSDRFSVGVGVFSYFGLAQEYDDDWVGRYYIQKGDLLGLTFMPAASFKVTDWLSVGAGLNAMYGYLDTQVAVRTLVPGDGQLSVSDETWGFGANVGLLFTLAEGSRLGATYLSPVDLDFEDRPSFSNLGPVGDAIFTNPPRVDLGMTVPQSVMVSLYHELNAKWALLANVGWQNWNEFGYVQVGVDSATPTSLTAELGYDDTWHTAVGTQYRASEAWLLSAGFAYDSSAVSDANRTVALPMGETYRFGLGAQWQVSRAVTLGAAYSLAWLGDMSVNQESLYRGRLSGTYEDARFSFFTANLTWRF
jgi:long-chain fatty acid transport protein